MGESDITYVLISLPENGTLELNGTTLAIGDTYTQTDIDNNLLVYTHDGSDTSNDAFDFEVLNGAGTWSSGNTFMIVIYDEALSAVPFIEMGITCVNASNAIVNVNVFGGVAPYLYSLNGVDFQDSNAFLGLGAGNYTFTIEDAMGTIFTTGELQINDPEALTATAETDGNDLTILTEGGTGTIMYSIDGDNFQSSNIFTGLENGDYTAYAVDENDCLSTTEFTILGVATSDIENNLLFDVRPNPNTGQFMLRILQDVGNEVVVSIHDMVGKQLHKQTFGNVGNRLEENMDISHLSSGIYLLHVSSESSFGTKRLVVVK